MIETWLITARAVHYAAVMALFGVALFPVYAFPDAKCPARYEAWGRNVLFLAALAALLTGVFWLQCVTANMSGSPRAAIDPDEIYSVLCDTVFGRVWSVRLVLSALLLGLTGYAKAVSKSQPNKLTLALLSAALLASIAGTGHTMLNDGRDHAVHVFADALHLLAAGAWLGGLLSLGFVLARDAGDIREVLIGFSGMGTIAVAVILASGLINSWYLVGSVANLVATPYGQILMVKLAIFAVMLALAAANRFWLVPALSGGARQAQAATIRLQRHVIGEQIFGAMAVLIVSVLGTLEPAIG